MLKINEHKLYVICNNVIYIYTYQLSPLFFRENISPELSITLLDEQDEEMVIVEF